jgi:hypothetical protein
VAALLGNTEILERQWDRAKEKLTAGELNNELLLTKCDRQQTVWHVAAKHSTQVLEKGSEWAKQGKLNLRSNMLLAQDRHGKTCATTCKI